VATLNLSQNLGGGSNHARKAIHFVAVLFFSENKLIKCVSSSQSWFAGRWLHVVEWVEERFGQIWKTWNAWQSCQMVLPYFYPKFFH
jgi:hypothetical protein